MPNDATKSHIVKVISSGVWQMSKSNFSGGLLLCLALSKSPLVITSSILKQIEKTYTRWKKRLQTEIKA